MGVWVVEGLDGRMLGILRGPDRDTVGANSGVGPAQPWTVATTVVTQGKAREVISNAATVGQLLSAMGMRPDPRDRVMPPLQTPLPRAPRIVFHSVETRSLGVETLLPFDVQTTTSSVLPPGEVRVVRSGVAGDALVRYRIRLVDGAIVARVRLGQSLLSSPVNEIRVVGASAPAPAATSDASPAVSRASTTATPAPSTVKPGVHTLVGEATWYHAPSHAMTAASPSLPFGTHVTVTNLANGKSVTVVINDRGPFGGRIIDLSEEAFARIARPLQGVCRVRLSW